MPAIPVKTKSGQTFEYGNTDDSKIEAQGKSVVRFWAVNKISHLCVNKKHEVSRDMTNKIDNWVLNRHKWIHNIS
jgi:DNA phosphorothioation-dependent restriction protein DptG